MAGKTIQLDMRQWILFLILSVLSLRPTAVVAGDTEGGDSPQAVFKAAQAAGAKRDYGTLVKLVAPSERPMLAFGTAMGVGMFVEFYEGEKADEMKKKYQEIQKKYRIVEANNEAEGEKLHITEETSQEVIDAHLRKRAERLYGHVNAVEYVPDIMAIVINMPEMAEQSAFPQEELSSLQIDGDLATGKAGEKTISFLRETGRWYLTADVMN
jgi:hypothetical protein